MHVVIFTDKGEETLDVEVPDEAAKVIRWLLLERDHQVTKFDYGPLDEEHAREGLTKDSWFWKQAILNYSDRVRIFGVTGDAKMLGVQALLKIVSSLAAQVEHLLRAGDLDELPKPGLSSGNLK